MFCTNRHYYSRSVCWAHTERASHYYIRAQCDTVRSIRTIRTAREAHSNCNIPRSINHKPTQAQKPRKAHSNCKIPRSINHKPTEAQKPWEAHSKCNFPSSVNQVYPCCRSVRSVRIDKPYNISCHENIPTKVPLMRCDLRTVKHTLQNVYPYCRSARSVLIDTCLIRTVTVWVCFITAQAS